jgi:hypothetical protein
MTMGRKIKHTYGNGIEYRQCSTCGATKPLNEFHKHGKYSDGSIRYRCACIKCTNEYQNTERDDPLKARKMNEWAKLQYNDYIKGEKIRKRNRERYKNKDIRMKILKQQKLQRNDPTQKLRLRKIEAKHSHQRRGLGLKPLNEDFIGAIAHHLLINEDGIYDNDIVYYISYEDNRANWHSGKTGNGLFNINELCLIRCKEQYEKEPYNLIVK